MSVPSSLFSRRKMQASPTVLLVRTESQTPEPSPVARSVSPSRASSKASSTRTCSSKTATPIHKRLAELRYTEDEKMPGTDTVGTDTVALKGNIIANMASNVPLVVTVRESVVN